MTWIAAVWKAPDNISLVESWRGWLTHRREMIEAIPTGSTAHLESEKRRWLIRSVETFIVKNNLLGRSSAGGTTRI